MLKPVLLSPLCLSLSQLFPLKALQTHLPHTSEWDVLQLLTGPVFPLLPIQAKKTPKNQGNSLGMFLKIRRRRILELSTGSGSIEQIFAMSSLCQDQGRLWRHELVVLLQGLSCRAVGSEAPTHPHCPLGICWLPLAGMWRENVLLCVSEGTQKLQIRHKTLRPKFGGYGKIFRLPWNAMTAALVS